MTSDSNDSNEIRNGEYSLAKDRIVTFVTCVYKNGQLLGYFQEDPLSNGYAVFVTGRSKPIGRPKSPRGCVLKLTNGEWDGKPEDATTKDGDPGDK